MSMKYESPGCLRRYQIERVEDRLLLMADEPEQYARLNAKGTEEKVIIFVSVTRV